MIVFHMFHLNYSYLFHNPMNLMHDFDNHQNRSFLSNLSLLMCFRVEIRIQFRRVPGNIYHKDGGGHMQDLVTNELILRDVPDEAILIRINNKIPGLGMNLEASELNLLYKDK